MFLIYNHWWQLWWIEFAQGITTHRVPFCEKASPFILISDIICWKFHNHGIIILTISGMVKMFYHWFPTLIFLQSELYKLVQILLTYIESILYLEKNNIICKKENKSSWPITIVLQRLTIWALYPIFTPTCPQWIRAPLNAPKATSGHGHTGRSFKVNRAVETCGVI